MLLFVMYYCIYYSPPRRIRCHESSAARKALPTMTDKRRILCVDAQDDICSLISTILSDHEVVSAHSKAEALRKATGGLFDL